MSLAGGRDTLSRLALLGLEPPLLAVVGMVL